MVDQVKSRRVRGSGPSRAIREWVQQLPPGTVVGGSRDIRDRFPGWPASKLSVGLHNCVTMGCLVVIGHQPGDNPGTIQKVFARPDMETTQNRIVGTGDEWALRAVSALTAIGAGDQEAIDVMRRALDKLESEGLHLIPE